MELSPKSQTVELIRASKRILILTHEDPDGDAVGSALALKLVLDKIGKESEVVLHGHIPEYLEFLPGFNSAKNTIEKSNELLISIDTSKINSPLKLGQKKDEDSQKVLIAVNSEDGALGLEDVTVTLARPKYDLVVFLDCTSLERIGTIADSHSDLFFETPTVSIDHHASNPFFAKVNWVDVTASATAEMMVSLIESLGRGEQLLDADIATCLFAGVATDTSSFRNSNTTPKSLTVAAQLIAAGARQQEIIERIYRTKSLSTLKLWGKALMNLEEDSVYRFAWTTISTSEIEEVNASAREVKDLVDELLKAVAKVDFVVLLYEKNDKISGSFRSVRQGYDVNALAMLFGGGGHTQAAGFEYQGNLKTHSQVILEKIRAALDTINEDRIEPIS